MKRLYPFKKNGINSHAYCVSAVQKYKIRVILGILESFLSFCINTLIEHHISCSSSVSNVKIPIFCGENLTYPWYLLPFCLLQKIHYSCKIIDFQSIIDRFSILNHQSWFPNRFPILIDTALEEHFHRSTAASKSNVHVIHKVHVVLQRGWLAQ